MKKLANLALFAVCLLGASSVAQAQTATANMGVSLTVDDECTLASTAMAFPDTGIIDADVLGTATLTVQCTEGTDYSIGLSVGDGADATSTLRQMTSADGDTVDYMIYQDLANQLPWGAAAGTTTVDNTATGADETITAYGTVASGQNVPAGTYTDTVVATITY